MRTERDVMALRTDYTNETELTDEHPSAHNDTNAAVNALLAAVPPRTRFGPPGRWVWSWAVGPVGTSPQAPTRMQLVRITMPQAFDAAVIQVTAAVAASTVKLGFYNADAQGLPTTLARTGSVDSSTVGLKQFTFPSALTAGLYWYAFLPSHGITVVTMAAPTPDFLSASDACPTLTTPWIGWYKDGPTALPDPVGTGYGDYGSPAPMAMLRLA
jgi:hypothetical protein